jgi:Putative zinc-finger
MNQELTHERCSELLGGALRGELRAEDDAAVRAHLSGCDRCRAELEGLRALVTAEPAEMTSAERSSLHREVTAALSPPGRAADVIPMEAKRTPPRGARWLGAAAAVIVVAVGAAYVVQQFGSDTGEAALEGGADSGAGAAGGDEDVRSIDGPRPVFADSARSLSDAPEVAAEGATKQDRTANQFSIVFGSTEQLRRVVSRSPLMAAFAEAYDASDAEVLADSFLEVLVEDAGSSEAAAQVEECGRVALDASIDPILPVFAAPTRYEGERALVLGYVTGEAALDRYTVWVWPEGSCDRPLDTDAGDLRP